MFKLMYFSLIVKFFHESLNWWLWGQLKTFCLGALVILENRQFWFLHQNLKPDNTNLAKIDDGVDGFWHTNSSHLDNSSFEFFYQCPNWRCFLFRCLWFWPVSFFTLYWRFNKLTQQKIPTDNIKIVQRVGWSSSDVTRLVATESVRIKCSIPK